MVIHLTARSFKVKESEPESNLINYSDAATDPLLAYQNG